MQIRIRIKAGSVEAIAELNDTATAQAIRGTLPITGCANRWGEEIYFSIPVNIELEAGSELVSIGDLGYWPPGNALCIFFGPTPISQGDEIRPAGAVTVFGKLIGEPTVFAQIASGTEITVEEEGSR